MSAKIRVYDNRYVGLCFERLKAPVVARAALIRESGMLWWKRRETTEGFAVVQTVYEPDAMGGDDYFRPVKFFESQDEAMDFAATIAVEVRS